MLKNNITIIIRSRYSNGFHIDSVNNVETWKNTNKSTYVHFINSYKLLINSWNHNNYRTYNNNFF